MTRFDPPSLPPRLALRAGIALVVAAALLWLVGCSSLPAGERAFLVASAADIGSTYYAVGAGCHEANPLWGRPGMSQTQAAVTSAAVTGLMYLGLRWYARHLPEAHRFAWWALFAGARTGAAGWNLYAAGECRR